MFVTASGGQMRFKRDSRMLNAKYRVASSLGVRLAAGARVAFRFEGGVAFESFSEIPGQQRSVFGLGSLSLVLSSSPLSVRDSDGDGVSDNRDRCASTPTGAQVDAHGCPRDSDGDGILDGLDRCPNTPRNLLVDSIGCVRDSDRDGVADSVDRCPNTGFGTYVDSNGCPRDSDRDGVPDAWDNCPNTAGAVAVDARGCTRDSDGDGVADTNDRCPSTPRGISVDASGCVLDSDRDGVGDTVDACPTTPLGRAVDARGCETDADRDGVEDRVDRCLGTLHGVSVDRYGCPRDADRDGVPDHLDKCPGTAVSVLVDRDGCPSAGRPTLDVPGSAGGAAPIDLSTSPMDVPMSLVGQGPGVFVGQVRVLSAGGNVVVFAQPGVRVELRLINGPGLPGSRVRMADGRNIFTFRASVVGTYQVIAETPAAAAPGIRARWVSAAPR